MTTLVSSCLRVKRVSERRLTDQMVSQVVAHVHFLHMAELGYLIKHINVELLEIFIDAILLLARQPAASLQELRHRVLVHVQQAQGLAEHGLVVQAAAPLAVATCSNFGVEGTVYSAQQRHISVSNAWCQRCCTMRGRARSPQCEYSLVLLCAVNAR